MRPGKNQGGEFSLGVTFGLPEFVLPFIRVSRTSVSGSSGWNLVMNAGWGLGRSGKPGMTIGLTPKRNPMYSLN